MSDRGTFAVAQVGADVPWDAHRDGAVPSEVVDPLLGRTILRRPIHVILLGVSRQLRTLTADRCGGRPPRASGTSREITGEVSIRIWILESAEAAVAALELF